MSLPFHIGEMLLDSRELFGRLSPTELATAASVLRDETNYPIPPGVEVNRFSDLDALPSKRLREL